MYVYASIVKMNIVMIVWQVISASICFSTVTARITFCSVL